MIAKRAISVLAVAALGLAACGGSNKTSPTLPTALPTALGTSIPSALPSAVGSSSGGSLSDSPLFGLTKLTKAQLCGLLSTSEANQILGSSTTAPVYANRLGLGITCEWMQSGGAAELYVGISSFIPWKGAQAGDTAIGASASTIDGHPAFVAGLQITKFDYAFIHVALGGDNDPVVECRGPSVAIATNLANIVTPRLLALAG